ncbi:hypothetical protein VNI00_006831 [Paramarasmius palmivorus]|uniref:Tyrosine specific protein phosphatases domain-containing protein n=1 Tax=Paramarasmius palmivorus TaxID=297713 RepID=A0AAW0D7Z3_9AGAR
MATNAIASSSKSGPSSPSRKTTLVVVDTPSRSSSKATLLIVDSPAKSLVSSDSVARPRPIPNSYWATPFLLACEYPWTPKNPYKPKLDALLQAGVRTFIDLTESGELLPYYTPDASNVLFHRATQLGINPEEIEYHRFPIRDRSLPNSVEDMYAVLEVLRDNEMRGRIAAVHCRGGIGRTGAWSLAATSSNHNAAPLAKKRLPSLLANGEGSRKSFDTHAARRQALSASSFDPSDQAAMLPLVEEYRAPNVIKRSLKKGPFFVVTW